mmetsp:Transcript_8121/g.11822  ORF Transcript_8121/g.11822 Transcript_8121/m.11822 type:complete len:169 (-) Transcript_8121:413-919(-)
MARPYSPIPISKAAAVISIRYDCELAHPIDIETLFLAFKLIEASVTIGPDRASHISPDRLVKVIAIVKVMFVHIFFLKLLEVLQVAWRAKVIIPDVLSSLQTFTWVIVCLAIAATYLIGRGRAYRRPPNTLPKPEIVSKAGVSDVKQLERHTHLAGSTVRIHGAPIVH